MKPLETLTPQSPERHPQIIEVRGTGLYTTPGTRKMDKLANPRECELPHGMNILQYYGGAVLDLILEESKKQGQFVAITPEYLTKTMKMNQQSAIKFLSRPIRGRILKALAWSGISTQAQRIQLQLEDVAGATPREIAEDAQGMIEEQGPALS